MNLRAIGSRAVYVFSNVPEIKSADYMGLPRWVLYEITGHDVIGHGPDFMPQDFERLQPIASGTAPEGTRGGWHKINDCPWIDRRHFEPADLFDADISDAVRLHAQAGEAHRRDFPALYGESE